MSDATEVKPHLVNPASATRYVWSEDYREYIHDGDECTANEVVAAFNYDNVCAQLRETQERLRVCHTLLRRYRTEVPLGHQPHMIAHLVDAAIGDVAGK